MWKNIKIGTKIITGFCLVFTLLGSAIYIEHVGIIKMTDRSAKSANMQMIVISILEARRHEKNLIIRGDVVYRDNTLKAIAEIKKLAQNAKEQFQETENKKLMDDVMAATADYEVEFRRLAEMLQSGSAQKSVLDEVDKKMVAAARKVQEACETAMKDQQMEMAEAVNSAQTNSIVFSLVAILVSGLAAFFITRSIVLPIQNVVEKTRHVAEGNLDISHLESGKSEMGQLGHSFNGMITNVSSSVKDVAATAAKVSVSAYRIHLVADHISDKTAEVAIQANSVAKTSKDISITSGSIAQNCQLAADGARLASQSAHDGSSIVDGTIKVMRQIADTVQKSSQTVTTLGNRSNQIGTIISTIKEIADQTNLLALNAAIEAARAGEHGRGFAVVADEVRALSERTSIATREIDEMIKSIQSETKEAVAEMERGMRQVDAGTAEAANSGEALKNILDQVSAVAVQVTQIAAAVEGQEVATSEISKSIDAISAAIQITAKDAHDSAQGAGEMNAIAEELMGGIGKFKVAEDVSLSISKAKSAHMIFLGKIKSHLEGSTNIDPNALPTHKTCAFGKWYQGKGHEACGHNSVFASIDVPHANVHELGKQAVMAYNAGEKDKARTLCQEMENNSMQLVEMLNKLNS